MNAIDEKTISENKNDSFKKQINSVYARILLHIGIHWDHYFFWLHASCEWPYKLHDTRISFRIRSSNNPTHSNTKESNESARIL